MASTSNQTDSLSYQLRDAIAGDVEQMSVLITELGYQTTAQEMETRFANINQNADYRTLVMVKDDRLVGMAGLLEWQDCLKAVGMKKMEVMCVYWLLLLIKITAGKAWVKSCFRKLKNGLSIWVLVQ